MIKALVCLILLSGILFITGCVSSNANDAGLLEQRTYEITFTDDTKEIIKADYCSTPYTDSTTFTCKLNNSYIRIYSLCGIRSIEEVKNG